jgi:hypothetical protein
MKRGYVHLVGIGPEDEAAMSVGARDALVGAEEVWMLDIPRSGRDFLRKHLQGKKTVALERYYEIPNFKRILFYDFLAKRLVHLANAGRRLTFALSGNPFVWVRMTNVLKEHAARDEVDLRVTPSMSFLDTIWHEVPFGVRGRMQLHIGSLPEPFSPEIDCVVGQVGDPRTTGAVTYERLCRQLMRHYGPSHPVYVSGSHPVYPGRRGEHTNVANLREVLQGFESYFYCVIIPGLERVSKRGRRFSLE